MPGILIDGFQNLRLVSINMFHTHWFTVLKRCDDLIAYPVLSVELELTKNTESYQLLLASRILKHGVRTSIQQFKV